MLIISTPKDFVQGNAIEVKINGQPATLTYRDAEALVVNTTDVREIFLVEDDGEMLTLTCGNAADEPTLPLYSSRVGRETLEVRSKSDGGTK